MHDDLRSHDHRCGAHTSTIVRNEHCMARQQRQPQDVRKRECKASKASVHTSAQMNTKTEEEQRERHCWKSRQRVKSGKSKTCACIPARIPVQTHMARQTHEDARRCERERMRARVHARFSVNDMAMQARGATDCRARVAWLGVGEQHTDCGWDAYGE
jgi:hypothetical protein